MDVANEDKGSKVLISNNRLLSGCSLVIINAQDLLGSSYILYEQKKYGSSTALGTVSIEESFKGLLLMDKLTTQKDLSRDDWKKLKNHNYKVVIPWINSIRVIEKGNKEEIIRAKKDLSDLGLMSHDADMDELADGTRITSKLFSNFPRLREYCLYINWDYKLDQWANLKAKKIESRKSINRYTIIQALLILYLLHYHMEDYVNLVRKKGLALTHLPFKLPYPKYEEQREEKDYESIKNLKSLDKIRSDIGKAGLDEFKNLIKEF